VRSSSSIEPAAPFLKGLTLPPIIEYLSDGVVEGSSLVNGNVMRIILSSFLAVLVVALSGCSAMDDKSKELIGNEAPAARLMFFDGSEVPLSSYRGKNVCLFAPSNRAVRVARSSVLGA
jgi:hypothetical protein